MGMQYYLWNCFRRNFLLMAIASIVIEIHGVNKTPLSVVFQKNKKTLNDYG